MISQQRIQRKNIFVFSLKNSSLRTMPVEVTGCQPKAFQCLCKLLHESAQLNNFHHITFSKWHCTKPWRVQNTTEHLPWSGLLRFLCGNACCCGLTLAAAQHHTGTHSPSPGGIEEWTGKVKLRTKPMTPINGLWKECSFKKDDQ